MSKACSPSLDYKPDDMGDSFDTIIMVYQQWLINVIIDGQHIWYYGKG